MGKWRKFIFGEKMPDKNDSQYKDRYEKEVNAGRKAASFLKIDKAVCRVQSYACQHPRRFMAIICTIIAAVVAMNVYRLATVCYISHSPQHITATQHQEQLLKHKTK